MPGEDFSALLASPATAEVNALHGALLYNHNVLACLDGEFMRKGVAFHKQGGNPPSARGRPRPGVPAFRSRASPSMQCNRDDACRDGGSRHAKFLMRAA